MIKSSLWWMMMGSKNEGADLRTKNRRGGGTGGSQWLRDG